MIQSNIQTAVLTDAVGTDLGIQSISIPAGFDRLVFSVPQQEVFLAFYENDLDNPYRRFYLSAGVANLVIPNPKGLGTIYLQANGAAGFLPDCVVSVMVL